MKIRNVIICGLGAIGLTYASKLEKVCNLKILVNKSRYKKYKKNPPVMNGDSKSFDYILPEDFFDADLIIISTKATNLNSVIKQIKNFVSEKTIIISLINGISSEDKIAQFYGKEKIVHSFYIGHSAIREDRNVFQDGVNTIVFNSPYKENKQKVKALKTFFDSAKINYQMPNDIIYSQWIKFGVNICLNQMSAILKLNIGELKQNKKYQEIIPKLLEEVSLIAKQKQTSRLKNYKKDVLSAIEIVNNEGKTSMLQDILAKRQTEVEIFAGEIIKSGKKYGIKTPYNDMIYKEIKKIEKRQKK